MSATYELCIRANNLSEEDADLLAEEVMEEFRIDADVQGPYSPGEARWFFGSGNISVGGDRCVEDYCMDFIQNVWEKAGHFIPVEFSYICMDDLPYDSASPDENDYLYWLQNKEGTECPSSES